MSGKIIISGFPRAGTTMMNIIFTYFKNCETFALREKHPVHEANYKSKKKFFVIKQPMCYWEDFPPKYTCKSLTEKYGYKVIFMVRDPRDVLVSKHNSNKDIYWVELKYIFRLCKEYLKNIHNPNVIFIRYEDFVTQPERELDRISSFIGCSYHKDFYKFFERKEAKVKENQSLGTPRKIDTFSIGNWRREEHQERIKEVSSDILDYYIYRLGYEI